jgi:hypothetical protein
MPRRELLALGLLAGCGRLEFDARPDAGGDGVQPLYTDVVLASSPAAYYRLAETGGMTVVDASGNGNDRQYQTTLGTIQYSLPGALSNDVNTAVRFDADGNAGPATSASVEGLRLLVDWAADFTIEMFYLPHQIPDPGDNGVVFVCESYLVNGFRVGWNIAESVHVWTEQAGGAGETPPSVPMSMTTFNHLAIVQQASQFTVYVDGVNTASATLTYVPAGTSDANCGFGSFHGMQAHATYDEVALYPRALDAAEIAAHAAAR